MNPGNLTRNFGFLVLKYDLYSSSIVVLIIVRAVSRGCVFVLVISRAMSGRSLGLAATRRLARVMIFSLATGGVSSELAVRKKKI